MQPYAVFRKAWLTGQLPWERLTPRVGLIGSRYVADLEAHTRQTDLVDVLQTAPLAGLSVTDDGYAQADAVVFRDIALGRDVFQFVVWNDMGLPDLSTLLLHHAFDTPWPFNLFPDTYALLWDAAFGGLFRP